MSAVIPLLPLPTPLLFSRGLKGEGVLTCLPTVMSFPYVGYLSLVWKELPPCSSNMENHSNATIFSGLQGGALVKENSC